MRCKPDPKIVFDSGEHDITKFLCDNCYISSTDKHFLHSFNEIFHYGVNIKR